MRYAAVLFCLLAACTETGLVSMRPPRPALDAGEDAAHLVVEEDAALDAPDSGSVEHDAGVDAYVEAEDASMEEPDAWIESDAGHDGGLDAGEMDSGSDAGTDAGQDAGEPLIDAGTDANIGWMWCHITNYGVRLCWCFDSYEPCQLSSTSRPYSRACYWMYEPECGERGN